jgi:hypothetical protein
MARFGPFDLISAPRVAPGTGEYGFAVLRTAVQNWATVAAG